MESRVKQIVNVGGGTGRYAVLTGLKNLDGGSITALVSMADSGGSTGILRDELGVLPAGDVRQCLVALSEHTDVVRKLMNYRFNEGSLEGHNFGNIFLAALEKVTGNFADGVEIASEILDDVGAVRESLADHGQCDILEVCVDRLLGFAQEQIDAIEDQPDLVEYVQLLEVEYFIELLNDI